MPGTFASKLEVVGAAYNTIEFLIVKNINVRANQRGVFEWHARDDLRVARVERRHARVERRHAPIESYCLPLDVLKLSQEPRRPRKVFTAVEGWWHLGVALRVRYWRGAKGRDAAQAFIRST